MAAVQELTSVSAPFQRSGRYQFRFWHFDDRGDRRAFAYPPVGSVARQPDLINTAYRNADGSRTGFGLAFDLDAHRADQRWLDDAGRLDWQRISGHLAENHPEIFCEIAYVVRSTGGKGLALLLAISPLPVQTSTERNQRAALNLQSRLIGLFELLGVGADPGARGLERDLPNFQDPSRCLYENRLALRRAEQGGEGILTKLHRYLNQLATAERRESRIYNDARAETGIARLVGWLLGAYDPQLGRPMPTFLKGEDVWASTATIAAVTGLSTKFLRRFLQAPPPWLEVNYVDGEGWRMCIPVRRAVQRLLPRAEFLLSAAEKPGIDALAKPKLLFSVAAIKEPHLVHHGEHNAWVTALTLAYKWHGYSRDEALGKVQLRTQALPDGQSSSTCREIRAIIKTLYKNVPQTFGRFAGRELPRWMVEDELFGFGKRTSYRGGVAPGLSVVTCGEGLSMSATLPKLGLNVTNALSMSCADQPQLLSNGDRALSSEGGLERNRQVALVAVRWRQRVGVFDGDELVLCVTKRHYRASAALALLGTRAKYAGVRLSIYTPHRTKQVRYHSAIESCEHALTSGGTLGAKPTFAVKIAAWDLDRRL